VFAPALTLRRAAETAPSRSVASGRSTSPVRSNQAVLRALETPVVQRAAADEVVQAAEPPVPSAPPPTPPPSTAPAPCPLPVKLGTGRVHSPGAADFQHFDFPAISATSTSRLKAWALTHLETSRAAVPDAACESEMDTVLGGFAGSAGHLAFARFRAGVGGTEVHGNGSPLGALALASSSFATTLAAVKADIQAQLAVQAAAGAVDACGLSVIPPETSFRYSSPAIAAVIGGTQGEELYATAFTGNAVSRSYTMTLRFVIDDHFGVDENDLYFLGLFPFWVLQHERSATLYNPFVNELDLSVPLSGSF
jgi:hypothetical protein